MKSSILSLFGIGAIVLAAACNNSNDEAAGKDSTSTTTTTTVDNTTSGSSADANVQTSADGRRYVLRHRTGSGSGSGTTAGSSTGTSDYDTVWLYMGTDNRYYTLHGGNSRDTLYYNTDEWNSWWNDSKTDGELKTKSGNVKVKVDDDGSWKVKDKDAGDKTKMNDKGEVKSKPKG